jgi:hypothetical protein
MTINGLLDDFENRSIRTRSQAEILPSFVYGRFAPKNQRRPTRERRERAIEKEITKHHDDDIIENRLRQEEGIGDTICSRLMNDVRVREKLTKYFGRVIVFSVDNDNWWFLGAMQGTNQPDKSREQRRTSEAYERFRSNVVRPEACSFAAAHEHSLHIAVVYPIPRKRRKPHLPRHGSSKRKSHWMTSGCALQAQQDYALGENDSST